MKRMIDLVAALIALPGVAVLGVLICGLIRLESAGKALFRQERVGRYEEPFTIVKFRTMHRGTGNRPTHDVGQSDVTRVGALLRRTKLDELPQLWNVLRGDMSLVGPRPCLPTQTELIERRREAGVFEMRPGITGPAQIAGIDMSTPGQLASADAAYAPAILTDLRLILATVIGQGSGDRVSTRETAQS